MRVLDQGYITLVEHMGGDDAAIRNARRCYMSEPKSPEADDKLLRHLMNSGHMTPFEAMVFTFDVRCPIFVARQWMRHRVGSYNEMSLRYCVAERMYYVPEPCPDGWVQWHEDAFNLYEQYRSQGMPRELARAVLPLGTYTTFFWTVNGSSLINFIKLRTSPHAQHEIREYAKFALQLAVNIAPRTFGLVP